MLLLKYHFGRSDFHGEKRRRQESKFNSATVIYSGSRTCFLKKKKKSVHPEFIQLHKLVWFSACTTINRALVNFRQFAIVCIETRRC